MKTFFFFLNSFIENGFELLNKYSRTARSVPKYLEELQKKIPKDPSKFGTVLRLWKTLSVVGDPEKSRRAMECPGDPEGSLEVWNCIGIMGRSERIWKTLHDPGRSLTILATAGRSWIILCHCRQCCAILENLWTRKSIPKKTNPERILKESFTERSWILWNLYKA